MRNGTRALWVLVAGLIGWPLSTACSDDHAEPSRSSSQEAVSTAARVEDSALARERVAELRKKFRSSAQPPSMTSRPAGLPSTQVAEVELIGAGVASFLAAPDGSHRPVFGDEISKREAKPARVELPATADGAVYVEDAESNLRLGFILEGAEQRAIATHQGIALYPAALGEGVDVVHRPSATGTEDFVVFSSRPANEEVRYRLDVSRVAGLRYVGGALELLDAGGAPRLRMSPPVVVDANGTRREAKVAITGCSYDTSPAAPWGRPVTAPGAKSCGVSISWDGSNLAYPLVLDPAWTTTGSMTYQRAYYPAIILLATGKVLAAGGYGCTPSCTYVGPTELYDRTTGTWSTSGTLANPRYYTSGEAITGGALVAGGYGSAGYLASAERYNSSTGTWSNTGAMASTRYLLSTVALADGKVLASGGYGSAGYLATAERYDPAVGTWTTAGSMTVSRYQHQLTRLSDGRVLATGGYPTTQSANLYNPSTNTWSAAANMADMRYGHMAAAIASGTKVFVAGGYGNGYLNTAEVYTVSTNTWATVSSMGSTRGWGLGAALANGRVLVAGGYGCSSGCGYLNSSEVFDPTSGTWTDTGNMTAARYYADPQAILLSTGEVLAAGGYGTTGYLNSAELFKLIAQGGPCVGTGECEAGFCVDGVCCDSQCLGTCRACTGAKKGGGLNGVCGPIVSGTDPDDECTDQGAFSCGTTGVCNGSSACQLYSLGTSCGTSSCTGSTLSTFKCNGGGACLSSSSSCAPYNCGSSTACRTTCTLDSHCIASAYCRTTDSTCQPDLPNGAACTSATQCTSGSCVDGVCCATACNGLCQACSVSKKGGGVDGECGPIKDGSDPENECTDGGSASCQNDGQCNGAGACRKYAKGTSCGATVCVGNVTTGKVCDGFGTCVNDTTGTDCTPYLCKNTSCANPCASDLDCTIGNFCEAGTCKGKQANGATCTGANACSSGYCVDGVCCATACTGLCQACSVAKKGGGAGGECGPIVTGTDPDAECAQTAQSGCGTDGQCNGAGSCRLWAKSTVCGADVCVGNTKTGKSCDGFGTCSNNATGTDCTPYVCGSGACQSPCATDANCTAGNFCKAGVCTPKQASGAICTAAGQCQSGYCVDGVCCATPCTGLCNACSAAKKGSGVDGECGAIANGTDPDADCPDDGGNTCNRDGMCNGFGACRLYSKGTACGSSACIGNKVSGQFCDGFGACQFDPVGTDCSPYICASNKCTNPCVNDASCTAGNYCDAGVCKGKQLSGSACTSNNQCASNYCVDGVCCATSCTGLCQACSAAKKGSGVDGECGPTAEGTDVDNECPDDGAATCKRDGMCNGFGACRLHAKSTSCGATQCVGNSVKGQICDGLGSCVVDTAGTDCAPYVCAGNSCSNPCNNNLDCVPGNFCEGGVCKGKSANGAACSDNSGCQSSYCVDGVCCATPCTGTCQACSASKKGGGADGECEPVKEGLDPDADCPDDGPDTCKRDGTCNGFGLCRFYAKGITCKANTSTCMGTFVKGYICDGLGTCEYEPTGTDCAPHLCLNNQCANPCTTDAECMTGNFCDTGTCKGKLANGGTCTAGTQCASGFCVDGVCCDTACTGQCEACDVAPNQGTCAPATGAPHGSRPQCKGAGATCGGSCDGVNKSACVYPGSSLECGTSCAGGSETPSLCDGNGECKASTPKPCAPYVCDGTDQCKATCAANTDCSSGYSCAPDKTCTPTGNSCIDDHTLKTADGQTKDCAPFKCDTGACKVACESVDDCVAPAICRASDKVCAAPSSSSGADVDSGGCGCDVPGGSQPRDLGALLAAALVALAGIRRRRGPIVNSGGKR